MKAPKLENIIKGITDMDSIEADIWGLGKIPISDFDAVVDIGSGDGVFSRLASTYHKNAVIIKADYRDRCNGDDVMPINIGDAEDTCFVARLGTAFCDQLGRPVLNIIATEACTSMSLHTFLDVYTKEFNNNRLVLKLSGVSLEHIVSEIPYIHNVKALLLMIPALRCDITQDVVNTLKQIFDIVEDYSSGDVMYVRCYHISSEDDKSDVKLLGSVDNQDSGGSDNNSTPAE